MCLQTSQVVLLFADCSFMKDSSCNQFGQKHLISPQNSQVYSPEWKVVLSNCCLEHTEHMDHQQKNGLCSRSGLTSPDLTDELFRCDSGSSLESIVLISPSFRPTAGREFYTHTQHFFVGVFLSYVPLTIEFICTRVGCRSGSHGYLD